MSTSTTQAPTQTIREEREHWAFFYKESDPTGQPLKGISYFCLTKSSSGIVSLERAVRVARRYERQGVNIVLNTDVKGNYLPLSSEEISALTAADPKIERLELRTNEHPGWEYLQTLLNKIPDQSPCLEES